MTAGATAVPLQRAAPLSRTDGERLIGRVERRVMVAELVGTLMGAVDVFLLLWLVLPSPEIDGPRSDVFALNAVVTGAYLAVAALVGSLWARRRSRGVRAWLTAGGRPPTERERGEALRMAQRCSQIDAVGWSVGALVSTLINLPFGAEFAFHIGSTILMGGLTCTALVYLLVERTCRPITARALEQGPPTDPVGPGVKGRQILAWLLATGVPVVGLVMVGCHVLVDGGVGTEQMARTMVVLSGIAIFSGLLATFLVAKSISEPLTALRRALGRIEAGDLDATVRVDDGSEVGLVQSGFNRMAAGLRERERLRDLFGRHVGEEVAEAALDGGSEPALGGEVRDVAVLFVDLVGSTQLAASRPPREVVKLLNDVFAIVVDVVARHGGWVNKFEGDAALCVFGAPLDHDDAAGAACASARMLRDRLTRLPDVDVGIGLSAGPAVAGNVGAEQRFEYTVIGDPVNEAARLCELAKRRPERVLASDRIVGGCRNGEGGRWVQSGETTLRGRSEPTRLASPVAG